MIQLALDQIVLTSCLDHMTHAKRESKPRRERGFRTKRVRAVEGMLAAARRQVAPRLHGAAP